MRFMNRVNNAFLKALVMFQTFVLMLLMDAASVWCADGKGLSKMADNLTKDMASFSSTVLWAGMVIGIGLIITGAVKLTKREGEGGIGKAVIFIAAGVLAVGIPALIKLTGESMLDSDNIGNDAVGGVGSVSRSKIGSN